MFMIGALIACNDDDDGDDEVACGLVGQYLLVEVLADPGDGSGTFEPVSSDKTIVFHSNGSITSNGDICSMGVESNVSSSGTYTLTEGIISSPDCNDLNYFFNGYEVIIDYPCFEACRAKFVKQ